MQNTNAGGTVSKWGAAVKWNPIPRIHFQSEKLDQWYRNGDDSTPILVHGTPALNLSSFWSHYSFNYGDKGMDEVGAFQVMLTKEV
jgi:hypothetical protein